MQIHDVNELGLRIRDRRQALGLSQVALAERAEVSRFWVMQVERGNPGAEIGLVFRAVRELGLMLDVRVAGPPPPSNDPAESAPHVPDLAAILDRARGRTP